MIFRRSRSWWVWGGVVLVLAVAAGVGTFFWKRATELEGYEARVRARLASVADARKASLLAWLAERRADAQVLAWDPDLVNLCVAETCPKGASLAHPRLHLTNLRLFGGVLGAYLFTPQGDLLLDGEGSAPPYPAVPPAVRRVAREHRVLVHDLHFGPAGEPMIGVLAPVFRRADPADRPADAPVLGVVGVYLEARSTLFPLLRTAPDSTEVEVYLVRRRPKGGAGAEVIRPGPGDPVRYTEARPGSVVEAALESREMEGSFLGPGGHRVIAAVRWISEAGWGLVVASDRDAALAPWRRTARWEAAVAGLAVLCVGLAWLGAWWAWAGRRHRHLLEEVRTSEERLQALARGSEDAVFLKDTEGRYEMVNPVGARLLGVSPEAAVGRRPRDFLPPESAAMVEAHDREVLRTGRPLQGEEVFPVGGEDRVFLASRIPIRDASGVIRGVAGVLRDITERKRWETELARRAQRLDGLYRLASQLTLAQNEEDVLHAVSEGALDAFGATAATLYRLDEARDQLFLAAGKNLPLAFRNRFGRIPRDHGVTGRVLEAETVLVVEDYPAHPAAVPEAADLLGVGAAAAVPLRAEGRTLGVLTLVFPAGRTFSGDDREALETLGHMAGVALERVAALEAFRAEARVRRRAEERLRRLHEATAAVTGPELFRAVVAALAREFGARAALLSRVNLNEGTGEPLAAVVGGAPVDRPAFTLTDTPCGEVAARNDLVVFEQGLREAFPDSEFFREHGLEAYAGFPVTDSGGRVIGIVCVFHDRPLKVGEAERELLALYARRVGGELERLRTETRLAETRRALSTLIDNLPGAAYRCACVPSRAPVEFLSPGATRVFGGSDPVALGDPSRGLAEPVVPEDRPRVWREIVAAVARGEPYEVEYRVQDASGGLRWVLDVGRAVEGSAGRRLEGILFDVTERRALEAQLTYSQRMEALGRLAGGVAHDFNNLLTAVSGYAEMVGRRVRGDGKGERAAREILKAVDRAAELTRQLLTFSRRQKVEPRVLRLNEALRDLTGMLERLLGEDVRLHLELGSGVGTVRADPGQLEQVVLNLVVNARDAMPRGGDLWVRTLRGVDGGRPVAVIEVEDTGTGIDPGVVEHIFEPFFTTKGEEKGTGLGLATVYGIVSQAGGRIDVVSRPGEGSLFRVLWPSADAPAAESPAEAPETVTAGAGRTVALVEDDPAVRDLAAECLRDLGYRVLAFASGEEAEKGLAGETRLDLLVTDVVMPGMRGPELLARLRERWPGLPAVLVSGHAGDQVDDLEMEGTLFLHKPFRLADLEAAASRALGHGIGEARGG
ncbi:GAF domain-containing protein [Deferrisoma camini]|uniref:GAF domain-containing protein n=1 Tax=Deferrisoma camini TaxID=1035120 RepID=UPI00046D65FF|nr:GAF domain-containing protein [Deferrisoma camini]